MTEGACGVNSPRGRGDLLSFRGLLGVPGGGEDTDFWRVSYMTPVGSYGTKVGAAYLILNYHLGTDAFRALNQRGDSTVASVFALHPIIRNALAGGGGQRACSRSGGSGRT